MMGRRARAGLVVALAAALGAPASAQGPAELRATVPSLTRNLEQNVISFWYPRTIDREHGGFLIDHDATGRFKGEAPKAIVTQARMVWLSSRLLREGRGQIAERTPGGRRVVGHQRRARFGEERVQPPVLGCDRLLRHRASGPWAVQSAAAAPGCA